MEIKEKILCNLEKMQRSIEFDELLHQYWFNGNSLISVTQLLKKHGLSPNYSAVNKEVLKKASNRGTIIHEDIEACLTKNVEPETMEAEIYLKWLKEKNLEPVACECFIGNEIACGQCDTVLVNKETGKVYIDDHKTGTVIHKEAVRWQCSIYAYLLGIYDDVDKILCSHLPKELSKCELIELEKIPLIEIKMLFKCEKNGIIYKKTEENCVSEITDEIAELYELELLFKSIEVETKTQQARRDELRAKVLKFLDESKVDKTEFGDMTISVRNGGVRKSFDATKLKEEMPEVYEKYLKETKVANSLNVKLGGW